MKYKVLLNKIRRINAFKLILPVVILVAIVIIFFQSSLWEGIVPTYLDSHHDVTNAHNAGNRYVEVNIPKLHYSGYDYMQGSDIKGHYYYSLENGHCQIYLIDKLPGEVPATLTNYHASGNLQFQPDNYHDFIRLLARDLNWTYDGLKSITGNVILSEPGYHRIFLTIMGILLFLALCVVLTSITILLFNIIRPDYAYTFSALGHHARRRINILRAAKEYEQKPLFKEGSLCITRHYLIYVGHINAAIIPLKDIMWIYKHSTFYHIILISWLSYTLRLVTNDNRRYKFRGNDKETVDNLLRFLQKLDIGILLGYTPANQTAAHQLLTLYAGQKTNNEK